MDGGYEICAEMYCTTKYTRATINICAQSSMSVYLNTVI
jgi:hypothetical protein